MNPDDNTQTKLESPTSCAAAISCVDCEFQSDIALVARIRHGDPSACDQLVRQHARQLFNIALRLTKSREDADDVTQEVFIKALRKLDQYRGESKLSTWLVRIAVNESLMQLRKRNRTKMISIDQDVRLGKNLPSRELTEVRAGPEQVYIQSEASGMLFQSIQSLPHNIGIVFTMRELENLSTQETATVLGVSTATVKSRLTRARAKLRQRLEPLWPPERRCGEVHAAFWSQK